MLSVITSKQPANSPLVLFFQARFEYISCVHKGPKDELPEKLKVESKQGILKQLALARTISMQDAIALTNMLDESKLPEDAAADIREAIQTKAEIKGDAVTAAAASEKIRQVHSHLENYQAAGDWACYASAASHENKLLQMARRMHSIFLYHPTEPTISGAVAIALYADGHHDPSYLLTKVRRMKEFLTSMFKQSGLTTASDWPKAFPAEVQHFKETHSVLFAAAFADDLPAACPVPAVMMQILKSGAPCRKTRLGCTEATTQVVNGVGRSQSIVSAVFQRQQSELQLPGFRWCNGFNSPPPLGAVAAVPAAQANGLLALADMPHQSMQPPVQQHVQPLVQSPVQQTQLQTPASPSGSSQDLTPAKTLGIAGVGATSQANAMDKGIAKVSDMVSKFQERAVASKAAAAQALEDEDDDLGAIGDTERPAMKRPAAATKSQPAAKKPKLEAAAKKSDPATLKSKPNGKTNTEPVAEKEFSNLLYKIGQHVPRYYGSVTVYTDSKNNLWRVKPSPGVRVEKKFKMRDDGAENRGQWKTLVAYVKSLKQQ
jgi:hypothetical protein